MNTVDREVGGHKYRVGRLDAMKQFHVLRRLGAVVASMGDVLQAVTRPDVAMLVTGLQGGEASTGAAQPALLAAIEPFLRAVGEMKDEEANYVIDTCLSVVSREQPSGWTPVRSGGRIMFDDVDMPTMLQLVWNVLEHNLSSFFSASLSA